MAESIQSPSGHEPSPKSQLDNLSRDDLIKFAKRQAITVRKLKDKCESLSKQQQQTKPPNADMELTLAAREEQVHVLKQELIKLQQQLSDPSQLPGKMEDKGESYTMLTASESQTESTLTEYDETVSGLKSENDKLRSELHAVKETCDGLSRRLEEAEWCKSQLKEVESLIETKEDEIEKQSAEIDHLNSRLEAALKQSCSENLSDQITELSNVVSSQKVTIAQLENKLRETEQLLREANDRIVSFTEESALKANNIKALNVDLSKLEQQLKDDALSNKAEIERITSELESLSQTKDETENMNEKLLGELEALRSEKDSAQLSVVELESKVKDLEGLLDKQNKDLDSLQSKVSEVETQNSNENLSAEFEQLRSEKNSAQFLVEELAAKVKDLEAEIDRLTSELQTKTGQEAEKHSLNEKLTAELEQLRSEKDSAESSVEELGAKFKELEELSDSHKKELDSLQAKTCEDLESSKAEIGRLMSELEAVSQTKDEMVSLNEKLTLDLDQLRSEKISYQSSAEELGAKVEELEELSHNQQKELDSLSLKLSEISSAENSHLNLDDKLTDVKNDLSVKEAEIARLTELNISFQQSLSESKENISLLTTQLQDLNKDNTSLHSQVSEMAQAKQDLENSLVVERRLLADTQTKVESLNQQLVGFDELTTKIQELEDSALASERDLNEAVNAKSRMEGENTKLSETVNQLQEQVGVLTNQLQQIESDLSHANAQLTSRSVDSTDVEVMTEISGSDNFVNVGDLDKLTNENNELNSRIASLVSENQSLLTEIKTHQLKVEEMTLLLDQARSDQIIVNSDKEAERLKYDTTVRDLEKKLSESVAAQDNLTKQISSLQTRLSDSEIAVESLSVSNTSLMTEIDLGKARIADLEEQLHGKVLELAQQSELGEKQNSKAQTLKNNLDSLQYQMDEAKREIEKLSATLSEKCDLLSENQTELEQLNEANGRYETEQNVLKPLFQKVVSAAEQYVKSLQSENVDNSMLLQTVVSECIPELNAVSKSNDLPLQNLSGLTSQLFDLFLKVFEAEKAEIQEKQARVSELSAELTAKAEEAIKLKQFALKAKKESAELKHKLEKAVCQSADSASLTQKIDELTSDINNLRQENEQILSQSDKRVEEHFQKSETEIRKLTDEHAQQTRDLTEQLEKAALQLAESRSALAETEEQTDILSARLKELEKTLMESKEKLSEKETELSNKALELQNLKSEQSVVEEKLTGASKQMSDLKHTNDLMETELKAEIESLKEELQAAKKEAKQNTMLDLEIADYERTIEQLNFELKDRSGKLKEKEEELVRRLEAATGMEKQLELTSDQLSQSEERANKIKQLLVKSKKELSETRALAADREKSVANLSLEIEALTQQLDQDKVVVSDLEADRARLKEQLRGAIDSHQRSSRSMEQTIQALRADLELVRTEKQTLETEYQSYKVRVHSVLKQQKARTSDTMPLEQERLEKQRLEHVLEQVQARLSESEGKVAVLVSEAEQLQDDNERLQAKLGKHESERSSQETALNLRLDELNKEKARAAAEHLSNVQRINQQHKLLTTDFRQQIETMRSDHKRIVDQLQTQLAETQSRLALTANAQSTSSMPTSDLWKTGSDSLTSFEPPVREERQQGEGMEHPDREETSNSSLIAPSPPTKSHQAHSRLMSFEELVSQPTFPSSGEFDTYSVFSDTASGEEVSQLKASLASSQKRIVHLNELLHDTDAQNVRLSEQMKVLKDEIRRLERNQERQNSVSNMEYLKNVVFKFLTLKTGDERRQLIPVLVAMLKLSQEEQKLLNAIASGEEGVPPLPGEQNKDSLRAYIRGWSGLI